jgi:DNA-binding CsgD family transcriptional regulator
VRQSKKIIEQKTQIFYKEKELNELELKNAVLKEEKLKTEINNQKFVELELQKSLELKSQLITSQTLQIIRKNNFLEKLKQELSCIKKGDKAERAERIHSLKKAINHDINSDENWNDFNMIFSQVHKDFFTNIQNQIEDISPAELRLCSLLRLNLHSQEIATILGISTDSLRIARYRLRKKLGLRKNDSLVNFLINI